MAADQAAPYELGEWSRDRRRDREVAGGVGRLGLVPKQHLFMNKISSGVVSRFGSLSAEPGVERR